MAKVKKPKTAKPAAGRKGLIDPAMAENFRHDVDQWSRLNATLEAAKDKLKAFEKGSLKKDGFTVKQVKDAILMATPEGMAQAQAEMANRLLVASYIGAKIGEQLRFFLPKGAGKVDSTAKAYSEGEATSIANKPMRCDYAPETKEYKAFVRGYQDHQEKLIKTGISKLDKSKAKTVLAEAKPKDKGAAKASVKSAADRAEARANAKNKDAGPPKPGAGMQAGFSDIETITVQ